MALRRLRATREAGFGHRSVISSLGCSASSSSRFNNLASRSSPQFELATWRVHLVACRLPCRSSRRFEETTEREPLPVDHDCATLARLGSCLKLGRCWEHGNSTSGPAATGWGLKKSRLTFNVIDHHGACEVKFGRWFVIRRAGLGDSTSEPCAPCRILSGPNPEGNGMSEINAGHKPGRFRKTQFRPSTFRWRARRAADTGTTGYVLRYLVAFSSNRWVVDFALPFLSGSQSARSRR
jgi:hypothetical protein